MRIHRRYPSEIVELESVHSYVLSTETRSSGLVGFYLSGSNVDWELKAPGEVLRRLRASILL